MSINYTVIVKRLVVEGRLAAVGPIGPGDVEGSADVAVAARGCVAARSRLADAAQTGLRELIACSRLLRLTCKLLVFNDNAYHLNVKRSFLYCAAFQRKVVA